MTSQADQLVERAEHLIDIGRADDALRLLGEALAAEPQHAGALTEMARAHRVGKRPVEALRAVDRALAIAPQDGYAAYLRADILVDLKYPQALEAADHAVRVRPWWWAAHAVRARALVLFRRRDEALAAARHAVSLEPNIAGSHYALADVAEDIGHKDLAEAEYREALRLNPTDAAARIGLAGLDMRRWRLRRGADHLLEAAPLTPRAADIASGLQRFVDLAFMLCLAAVGVAALVAIASLIVGAVAGTGVGRVMCAVMAGLLVFGSAFMATRMPRAGWPLIRSMVRVHRTRMLAVVAAPLAVALLGAYAATGQKLVLFVLVLVAIPLALTADLMSPEYNEEREKKPKTADDILY